MALIGALLMILAIPIALMAAAIGAAMVIDPDSIQTGLVSLVFLAALAGACWVIGAKLRRDSVAARDWED